MVAVFAVVVLVYLFVPVAYTFAVLVQQLPEVEHHLGPQGSPTLKHWENPCGAPGVCGALGNSLKIGLLATLVATVLGTLIAFALVRHRFRGRAATNILIFVPMATPEVVMGASLLTVFVQAFAPLGLKLGFWTIVIAHIMFCLSFVVVTVKARVLSLDPTARGGRDGPLRQRDPDLPPGDLPAGAAGHRGRRACCRSRCPSTTSSSPTSSRATRRPSRSSSTCPTCAGSPLQANVIGFSMFVIAVAIVVLGQFVGSRRRAR